MNGLPLNAWVEESTWQIWIECASCRFRVYLETVAGKFPTGWALQSSGAALCPGHQHNALFGEAK